MAKRNWEGALISSIVSEGDLKKLDNVKETTQGTPVCYDDQLLVRVKAILETTRSKYKQEGFSNILIETPGFPPFVMYRVNAPDKYLVFTVRRAKEFGTYVVHIADGISQTFSEKTMYLVDESRVLDFVIDGFIPDNTAVMQKVAVKRADSWVLV